MGSYQIDRERWSKMNILEQMGNIGSEVGRSIIAWRNHDTQRFEGALDRALDLFDATTEQMVKEHSPRIKEVLRSKDQYLRLFFDGTFDDDADAIESYFMQYALASRINR